MTESAQPPYETLPPPLRRVHAQHAHQVPAADLVRAPLTEAEHEALHEVGTAAGHEHVNAHDFWRNHVTELLEAWAEGAWPGTSMEQIVRGCTGLDEDEYQHWLTAGVLPKVPPSLP